MATKAGFCVPKCRHLDVDRDGRETLMVIVLYNPLLSLRMEHRGYIRPTMNSLLFVQNIDYKMDPNENLEYSSIEEGEIGRANENIKIKKSPGYGGLVKDGTEIFRILRGMFERAINSVRLSAYLLAI